MIQATGAVRSRPAHRAEEMGGVVGLLYNQLPAQMPGAASAPARRIDCSGALRKKNAFPDVALRSSRGTPGGGWCAMASAGAGGLVV